LAVVSACNAESQRRRGRAGGRRRGVVGRKHCQSLSSQWQGYVREGGASARLECGAGRHRPSSTVPLRRSEPWVEAATHAVAACVSAAVATVHVVRPHVTAESTQTRNPRSTILTFDGWQQGVRVDRRDAVAVAVQQRRVVGARRRRGRGLCIRRSLLAHGGGRARRRPTTKTTTAAAGGGSRRRESQKWKVPQWEVLAAANRAGWEA
jgi:hypothetical protein